MLETPNKKNIVSKVKDKKSILDNFYVTISLGFIITAILSRVYYQVYFVEEHTNYKIISLLAILCFICFIIVKSIKNLEVKPKIESISKIILIDECENNLDEWFVAGKSSMIIGKNTKSRRVDIDLSKTKDEYLISKNHAVMNYAANNWYIEDLGSAYGLGIKKIDGSFRKKLKIETPYKLEKGDIICINNVRLILK